MVNDIPCPICAATVPLRDQQSGLELKCPACHGKFLLTDELIEGKKERPTFRPAPRRRDSGSEVAPADLKSPLSKTPAAKGFAKSAPVGSSPVPSREAAPPASDRWAIARDPRVILGAVGLAGAFGAVALVTALVLSMGRGSKPELAETSFPSAASLLATAKTSVQTDSGVVSDETYQVLKRLLSTTGPERKEALQLLSESTLSEGLAADFDQQLSTLLAVSDPGIAPAALEQILIRRSVDTTAAAAPQQAASIKANLRPLLPAFSATLINTNPQARRGAMRTLTELGPAVAQADEVGGLGAMMPATSAQPGPTEVMLPKLVNSLVEIWADPVAQPGGVLDDKSLAAQAVRSIDAEGKHAAEALIYRLGAPLEAELLDAIKGEDVEERRFALYALGPVSLSNSGRTGAFGGGLGGGIGVNDAPADSLHESTIAALVEALAGDDLIASDQALKSLARLDSSGIRTAVAVQQHYPGAATATLTGLLVNLEKSVETPAAEVPHLTARAHVARCLGALGSEAAAAEPVLSALARSKPSNLQFAAANALQQIQASSPALGPSRMQPPLSNNMQPPSGNNLIAQLQDRDAAVRSRAVQELIAQEVEARTHLNEIVSLAVGTEPGSRVAASTVLNKIDPTGAMAAEAIESLPGAVNSGETLLALLKTEPETRRFASRALGMLGARPQATPTSLVAMLVAEPDTNARRDLFHALSRIDPVGDAIAAELTQPRILDEAHLLVSPAFRDPDPQLQACLNNVLVILCRKNPKVINFLAAAASNADANVQATARAALTSIDSPLAGRNALEGPAGASPRNALGADRLEVDQATQEKFSALAERMMNTYDLDFDGVLSRGECKGALAASFIKIDRDASRDLTWDELYDFYLSGAKPKPKAPAKAAGMPPSKPEGEIDPIQSERAGAQADKMLETLDQDFDGAISRVECRGPLSSTFAKIDIDSSGDLTWDELYDFYLVRMKRR